jgi:hypothetical protein
MKKLENSKIYHEVIDHKGSSFFKKIALKSLLHALKEEVEQSPAMALGSAVHCAILEPEKFSSEYAVAPKVDRRTKEGKEIFAAFEADSNGKTILTADQMETIEGMKTSVLSHEIALGMLTGGEAEYSYYVTDSETGIGLKCRPDFFNKGALIDLKTCRDASVEGFTGACFNMGYFIQAAFYLDVFNAANGTKLEEFYFVAVENTAPFAVNTFKMGEAEIAFGREQYKKALKQYADYLKQPERLQDFGYKKQINEIAFRPYMFEKMGA